MKATITNLLKPDGSKRLYLLIAAIAVAGKIILTFFPVDHPVAQMPLFRWSWIAFIIVAGYISMVLADLAAYPELWNRPLSRKRKILLPVSLGIMFSIFQIVLSIISEFPDFNAPFPYSIPVYISFGTLYEILFHLVPLVLLTWLVSLFVKNNRTAKLSFFIIVALISLYEPYAQIGGLVSMELISKPWEIVTFAIYIYLANFVPLVLFRQYGFLAMILFRYANYTVWHIIWPAI